MKRFALALLALALPLGAEAFDHSHAQLAPVLKRHVREGRVDYAGLKASRGGLDEYLRVAGAVTEDEFKKWTKKEQLAFLINLYNAATLQVIIDRYPLKSIKDAGTWFKTPWELDLVTVFGARTTLDYIEHGLLRPNYQEPRIHFALVCAAKSCPPLRNEPYLASRIDAQLDEQGRLFMNQRDSNRIDAKAETVFLSPIFKWFRADFESPGNPLLKFVTPYFSAADQKTLGSIKDWKIRYTRYDWNLNDVKSSL